MLNVTRWAAFKKSIVVLWVVPQCGLVSGNQNLPEDGGYTFP
jgi:hypothetical protein